MSDDTLQKPGWRPMSPFPGNLDSPPPAGHARAEFGACSRRGPLRAVNDDHYLILRLGRHQETLLTSLPEGAVPSRFDEFAFGMVIADGVGRAAETASRCAITTLAHLAIHFGKWNVRINEPVAEEVMDRAERFYKNVDSALVQAGQGSPAGLQTTLTVAYAAGNELFFAYVGDSSAYLLRDGRLSRLTRDRSLIQERPGAIWVRDVAAGAPDLTYLVAEMLGDSGPARPKINVERCGLLDGDLILLCTKGLTNVVDDARIADMLRLHTTPNDQCRALVDLADGLGSYHDVTALVAHYHIDKGLDGSCHRSSP
jgi:PPM family protein phosphatase